MSKIRQYLSAYHPIVQVLLAGTVFISLTSSMSMPFLAIYLAEQTELDYALIGLIIGAGPLAGTIGGFVGGTLSDFFGRKRLMILSLLVLFIVFGGFVYARSTIMLLLLSIVRGLAASFFATISKALMGDLTPEEKRFRVFSNRYLAINLGYSIGPVVGAFLGISGSALTFFLTAAIFLLYALVLPLLFSRYLSGRESAESTADDEPLSVAHVWSVVRNDGALLMFVLGGVMLMTVHGEVSVPLSQYLQKDFVDGVKLFGLLMSVNGLTVLLIQVWLTRWSERFSLFRRMVMGSLLLSAGAVVFAFAQGWISFIVAMFVFTLGEILLVPAEYAQIDQITPPGMRGTYYGAQGFSELGNFLGPWLGGMLLSAFGGTTMFLVLALISLASLLCFARGRKLYEMRKKQAGAVKPPVSTTNLA
ncbi:MFS transporter [Brevibacillus humidisoli]|uniref:MDR family MFS transporter n=1 Tax=Brevibacillus humidisoli TaxID=2895522 RepID=UPI001E425FE3|nr:MFS transporter [Brevibacillus humidisoli]UFJ42013.1 MFS transporter [Brevibacillus humidisoli]